MYVFNTPPGWPPMPNGWMPEADWKPADSWPLAPPGWNFVVHESLKMCPIDLGRDLDAGPAGQVSMARLSEIAQGAADAVAWRTCTLAAEAKIVPMMAYLRYQEEVEQALVEAQHRIFDRLLENGRNWINQLSFGSTEWTEALQSIRPMLDSRENFMDNSRQRIVDVLEASNSAGPDRRATQASRPAATPHHVQPVSGPRVQQIPRDAELTGHIAEVQRAMNKAMLWAVISCLVCLLGAVISFAGYSAARTFGGNYVVFGGAVVFGAIGIIRNLNRYTKLKTIRSALQDEPV